jgi:hypothetical protein
MLQGTHGHAGVLGHELFRVGGHGTVHMQSLLLMCTILVFINTSADPPEEKIRQTSFKSVLNSALFDVFMA